MIRNNGEGAQDTPRHEAAAWLARGWAALARDNVGSALEAFTRAIDLDPGAPDGYLDRASAYEAGGDFQAALADYTAAATLAPSDPWPYVRRAAIRVEKGALTEALHDYGVAIGLDPAAALPYCRRGDVHRLLGDFPTAIRDYTTAIALDPAQSLAYVGRGASCAALIGGAMPELDGEARASALDDYRHYLALRPDAPDRVEVEAALAALGKDR